nr:MAG TPA: Putative head tail adaptor [Caudoviricetes sp.]
MINAGKYKEKISVFKEEIKEDSAGFTTKTKSIVLNARASVKTTRGYTLIANDTDFEKAYTNFTIRFPKTVITRDMLIEYKSKIYSIEYLNNIDEADIELEIQAKVVAK